MGVWFGIGAILWTWTAPAVASRSIEGQVLDIEGQPVARAVVKLTPGAVSQATDDEGRFAIDRMRSPTGSEQKLERRTDYTLEVFKVGYAVEHVPVAFRRGRLRLAPVTLVQQVIDLDSTLEVGEPPAPIPLEVGEVPPPEE